MDLHLIEGIPDTIHSLLATKAFQDGAVDYRIHLHFRSHKMEKRINTLIREYREI